MQAATRGDGATGDLITAQVLASGAVPERVPCAGDFEVRGELYLPRPAFEALNRRLVAEGGQALVNPRNGCAGLMKRKDPADLAGVGVAAFLYHLAWAEGVAVPAGQHDRLGWLRGLGLPVHPESRRVRGVLAAYQRCREAAALRGRLDHDLDGMVLKYDDTAAYDALGATGHHPRWGIAYKFPPERRATVLRAVTVQVGRASCRERV